MAATIAAVASAVASAAAAGAGAIGSAAASLPAALSSLVAGIGGGGAAAAPSAASLAGATAVPFTGAAALPGAAGSAGFSGGTAAGAGAGALGSLPSGAAMPSAAVAAPSIGSRIMDAANSASEWATNPGQKAVQAIHKATSTQPEPSPGLKIVGNLMTELSGGAPSAPRPAAAGKGPGQLVQPAGAPVASQFEIGSDGLLHWKGAPTARVGGGPAYG